MPFSPVPRLIGVAPISRRSVALGGLSLFAGTVSSSLAFAADAAGDATFVKGEAYGEQSGVRRKLAVGAKVFVGDLLSTGPEARLFLNLGKNTTLKLGGGAQVRIDRYLIDAGGEFNLISGPIQFERTVKSPNPDLKFRSVYGLIAVRGTRFFAGPSKGVFGVLVGHGRVEVTGGGRSVLVGAQQGTDFARIGARPSPVKTWGGARVQEALASVR